MKRVLSSVFLAVLFFVVVSANVYAAGPWGVTPPKAGVNAHEIENAPAWLTSFETYSNGQFVADFGPAPIGVSTFDLYPLYIDPVWGKGQRGPKYVFTFTRPALSAPTAITGGTIQKDKPIAP